MGIKLSTRYSYMIKTYNNLRCHKILVFVCHFGKLSQNVCTLHLFDVNLIHKKLTQLKRSESLCTYYTTLKSDSKRKRHPINTLVWWMNYHDTNIKCQSLCVCVPIQNRKGSAVFAGFGWNLVCTKITLDQLIILSRYHASGAAGGS